MCVIVKDNESMNVKGSQIGGMGELGGKKGRRE